MLNNGPNTNSSLFAITTAADEKLDGKNVVFGKVIKGKSLIRTLEHELVCTKNRTYNKIVIDNCGVIPAGENDGFEESYQGDLMAAWPEDNEEIIITEENIVSVCLMLKDLGNSFIKEGDFRKAISKYDKVLKLISLINY